jgi:hypothetical protein
MKRRIVPGGILALSLAVVLMAATASTASADRFLGTWNCPPPSPPPTTLDQIPPACFGQLASTPSIPPTQGIFDFGYHQLGTSAAQRFALGVTDNDSFNPRIGVSGDYAQTNNCRPTLSAGADPQLDGCLIDVTFTPTGEGFKGGTLTTGPGGPTAALTGTTERPHLRLSAKKKQSLRRALPTRACLEEGRRCKSAVKVKASCGDMGYPSSYEGRLMVACTARAKGKLTKVKKDKLKPPRGPGSAVADLTPGDTENMMLKLTNRTRKQARKALAEGKNVQAKVTVKATDAAGNVAVEKRTVKLVK